MDNVQKQPHLMERSNDSLFEGELDCLQHINGYRFSLDPVLLAHFVYLKKDESVLDLGAGCGILGLILLYRHRQRINALTAFEIQSALAQLCRENSIRNSFQGEMAVVEGDLRKIDDFFTAGSFSTVVCNPPFYLPDSGRKSVSEESAIARHQVQCTLDEILSSAAYTLKNKGRFFLIYPADQLAVLINQMQKQGFAVKRLQMVYSYPAPDMPARLILLEASKNGGHGMLIEEPFYIYSKKNGEYSPLLQSMYKKRVR